jgi:hypothetical protein
MMQVGPQQGWQCPLCKAVMSPWAQSCIHCRPVLGERITMTRPHVEWNCTCDLNTRLANPTGHAEACPYYHPGMVTEDNQAWPLDFKDGK